MVEKIIHGTFAKDSQTLLVRIQKHCLGLQSLIRKAQLVEMGSAGPCQEGGFNKYPYIAIHLHVIFLTQFKFKIHLIFEDWPSLVQHPTKIEIKT